MSHETTTATEEVTMQKGKRNPIQRSFGAGINRPQVVPNKKRDRRVKHRQRWREDNAVCTEEAHA